MFEMFGHWVKEWGIFGESYDFIEEIVDIFMNFEFIFHYVDNKIIFMETTDKNFYVFTNKITKEEGKLLLSSIKMVNLKKNYTTTIEYTKIKLSIKDHFLIRCNICEWFIIFDITTLPRNYNIIERSKVYNKYIESLKRIKIKYKFKFIDNIIFSLLKIIQ